MGSAKDGVVRVLAVISLLIGAAACLQLDMPGDFHEKEDVRYRSKNLHRYYQDLEQDILQEQYNIKLLQDTLNINLAREQALAEELSKQEARYDSMKKDQSGLTNEVAKLEAELKLLKEKRQGVEGSLKAEKDQTEAMEKNIEAEKARLVELNTRLAEINGSIEKVQGEIAGKEKTLNELKAKEAAVDEAIKEAGAQKDQKPPENP